jgi:hypothetical protein
MMNEFIMYNDDVATMATPSRGRQGENNIAEEKMDAIIDMLEGVQNSIKVIATKHDASNETVQLQIRELRAGLSSSNRNVRLPVNEEDEFIQPITRQRFQDTRSDIRGTSATGLEVSMYVAYVFLVCHVRMYVRID